MDQRGVRSLADQQLLVRPGLDDPALVHDQDQVGVARSCSAGARSRSSCSRRSAEVAVHLPLGHGVEGAGRLVEQQDRAAGATSARASAMRWRWPPESEAPPSASGSRSPSASRAMSSWMHASCARPRIDRVERQRRVGERDVLADRRAEQVRVLGHDADLAADRTRLEAGEVDCRRYAMRPDSGGTGRAAGARASTCPEPGAADDAPPSGPAGSPATRRAPPAARAGRSGTTRPRRGSGRASCGARRTRWPCCSRGVSRTSLMRSM